MHIILAVLSVLVYSLWLMESLRRNGFKLSSFNPFAAYRRRQWMKQRHANPLCSLDDPCDITTVLLLSLAKSTGEITREQKNLIIATLRTYFKLDDKAAQDYFVHNSFHMRDTIDILGILEKVVQPFIGKCTEGQMVSLEEMMRHVATDAGQATPNEYQTALITKTMEIVRGPQKGKL